MDFLIRENEREVGYCRRVRGNDEPVNSYVVMSNSIYSEPLSFSEIVNHLVHERNHAEQFYDADKGEKLMNFTEKNYRNAHNSRLLYSAMANEIDSFDLGFKVRDFVKEFGHEKATPKDLKKALECELKSDVNDLNCQTGTLSARKEEKKKKELAFKTGVLKKMSGGAAMS